MDNGKVMQRTKDTERGMVAGLKAGDMAAFDSLYRRYAPRLFGFALHLVKSRSDAEEIVQEVFLKVWKAHADIDLQASFGSYLFTITYNTVVSILRKRSSEKKYLEYVQSIQLPEAGETISADLEWQELQARLQVIVNQLPGRQQEIYRLSREEGLSYQEIAQKLELSVNTVENHMARALKFIRSRLADHSLKLLLFFYLFF